MPYTEPESRYLLLDQYGEARFFYCDPDEYPIGRGDELERALKAFPAIQNDTAEFAAITARTGLVPPYSEDAKLGSTASTSGSRPYRSLRRRRTPTPTP